jgi:protein O-mannosyl-transferase
VAWWTRASEPRPAAAIVVIAVIAAFGPALTASFQFDDWNVVVADPRVQSVVAWWNSMPGIRPLTKLSYALNHAAGSGVAGFRTVNIAIHASAALAVLALVRMLGRRAGWPAATASVAALFAALLFALHPVQTESVTYISGRSGALAVALSLASVLAWLRGVDAGWAVGPAGGPRAAVWRYGVSPVLMLLALAAKELAIVVPPTLLLVGALPDRTAGTVPPLATRLRMALAGSAVHWLILLAALVAVLAWPPYRELLALAFDSRPLAEHVLSLPRAITWLLGQLLWPVSLNADPAIPGVRSATPTAIAAVMTVLIAVAAAISALRTRPELAVGLLWFLLWLGVVLLLPRPDLVNDRQLYGALIGAAWLAAVALVRLLHRRLAAGGLVVAAAASLAIALAAMTVQRGGVYRDEVAFWNDVLVGAPHNARAHNNLGMALANACDTDGADAAFNRATAIDPGYVRAGVNARLLASGSLPRTDTECATGSSPR